MNLLSNKCVMNCSFLASQVRLGSALNIVREAATSAYEYICSSCIEGFFCGSALTTIPISVYQQYRQLLFLLPEPDKQE